MRLPVQQWEKNHNQIDKFAFTILKTLTSHTSKGFYLFNVATAQRERGIWIFIFPDRENTGNFRKQLKICFTEGIYLQHRDNFNVLKTRNIPSLSQGVVITFGLL